MPRGRLVGHTVSPETRAKISLALKGTYMGSEASAWKGDRVGSSAIHMRLKKILPTVCAFADNSCSGRLDVSLRKDSGTLWDEDEQAWYGTEAQDYWRLCSSHHIRYDKKRKS